MEVVTKLENQLKDLFKGFPALPKNAKETLVSAWPWLALIFGVLQLLAAYQLYRLTRVVEGINEFVNAFTENITGQSLGLSAFDRTLIYSSLAVLVVEAVLFLIAFPELQKKSKKGWNLLFLGALVNVVYSVVTIFIDGRGIGSFIVNMLGSAVGFYLLFQVHDYYGSKKSEAPKA